MGVLVCRVVLPLAVMWFSVSAHAAATLELYGTFHAMGVVVTIDAADDPNGTAVSSVAYRIYGRRSPCRLWFKKADTFRGTAAKVTIPPCGIRDSDPSSLYHRSWVEEALRNEGKMRASQWSESITVGSLSFVEQVKTDLGARGFGRKITSSQAGHELREARESYDDHFGGQKAPLSHKNAFLWRIYDDILI